MSENLEVAKEIIRAYWHKVANDAEGNYINKNRPPSQSGRLKQEVDLCK